jgi:DNA-binding NarL/FixJ family response regulator
MPVAIICQRRLVREMLSDLFDRSPVKVCDICENVSQLAPLEPGDVVLLHADGPLDTLMSDLRELRQRAPWSTVVLVADSRVVGEHDQLRPVGVGAVLTQDSSTATLVGAVSVVQAGFSLIAEPVSTNPLPQPFEAWAGLEAVPSTPMLRNRSHPLSAQEMRILTKLVRGGSNKDLANELGIAEATVKVHLRACYDKIGVRNRTQAAMWAALYLQGAT